MKLSEIINEATKIQGFIPFKERATGYGNHTEWVGGLNPVWVDGSEHFFTGKTGKSKSGKLSFEYSAISKDGEDRVWVTVDGEVQK